MALNAEEYVSLDRAELVDYFKQNRAMYKAMAKRAYAYAQQFVAPTGEDVRPDDVAAALLIALKIHQPLLDCLVDKKVRGQKWIEWFGDLIIDRLWEEL